MHILVVDDETFVLNLSVRILNKLGYENIKIASNGKLALEMVVSTEESFDLIVCDLNMPEMDGIELMRHIQGSDFEGSMILLSGEDRRMLETAMDLAKAHDIDILGAIPKPLKPDALEKLLENFTPQKEKRTFSTEQILSKEELESAINSADCKELVLFYQPKVSIKTGEITGVETLARWQHIDRGILGPGAFIPLAEKEGLIHDLSYVIYRKSVEQVSEWLTEGINMKTSVNFSINTFSIKGFPEFITSKAQENGVSPEQMVLEVTESQIMENAKDCLEMMMRMRLKKFGLSIDDFGTGNSSMVQLKAIPFTELKIDRAFVFGAAKNPSTRAILETSVDLAKKLDMEIVAEGAETREDWDLVEELGCDYVQGYYCAKPMPNIEFLEFLKQWNGPHK